MKLLLLLMLTTGKPAMAGTCSDLSLARVESAESLLAEAQEADAIDRASVVERARILLERVLAEDPGCGEAKGLKRRADKLLKALTPVSEAASLEAALIHALERVEGLEQAETPDPEEVQTVRFMLAGLADRFGDDERVEALIRRAWAVGR